MSNLSARSGRLAHRETHGERGRPVFHAFHTDLATVLLDDMPRAGETDAGSPDRSRDIRPPEVRVEHAIQLLRWDADAAVRDGQPRPSSTVADVGSGGDRDLGVGSAVLHRVGDQVGDDAADANGVPVTDEVLTV